MRIDKQNLKRVAICAFTVVFCSIVYQAKAGTTTWTGAQDTLWSNANNWSTSGGSTPPASGDDVVITSKTLEPTFDVSGGATIGSLTINSSSTLKLDGTNALTVSGNTSVGSGGLLMTRRSTFTSGDISGSGELSVFGATTHIKGNLSISTYSSYSYVGTQSYMIFDGTGPQNIGGCLAGTGGTDFNINSTNIEIANQNYPVTTTADIQFNIMTIDAGAEFKPGASYKVHADNEIQNIIVYGTIDVTYCSVTTDNPKAQYIYNYSSSYAVVQYYNQGTLKFAGTAQQEETANYDSRTSNTKPINIEIANTSDTVRFTVSESASNNLTVDAGAVLRAGALATVTAANIIVNGTARVSRVSNTSDGFAEQFIATSSYTLTNGTLLFVGASAQKLGDHNFKNLIINTTSGGLTLTGTSGMTISGNITGTGTLYGGSDNVTVGGTFSISNFTPNTSTFTLSSSHPAIQSGTYTNLSLSCSSATLSGDVTVTGTLHFTSGVLDIGSHKLTIGTSGSITGFSSSNYIYTSGSGTVEMTVTTSGATFYIGDGYNPITIIPSSGTATYDVAVSNGVTDASNVAITGHIVNATWTITVLSGSQTVTVIPQWDSGDELTGFDRARCDVAYRTSLTSSWISTESFGNALGSGPYTRTSNTFTIAAGNTYYIGVGDNISSLPVTLVSFNAAIENNHVNLNWRTSSEINNNYFGVERSIDGKEWQMIGQVAGHGNSQVIENYAFTDNLTGVVPSTDIYYRLKQVDYNGKYAYSEIRSINTAANSLSLQTYPNPVGNVLNLSWDNKDNENVVLNLINISGTTVYTENVSGTGLKSSQVDLSGFAPGTYILQIVNNKDVICRMIYKR